MPYHWEILSCCSSGGENKRGVNKQKASRTALPNDTWQREQIRHDLTSEAVAAVLEMLDWPLGRSIFPIPSSISAGDHSSSSAFQALWTNGMHKELILQNIPILFIFINVKTISFYPWLGGSCAEFCDTAYLTCYFCHTVELPAPARSCRVNISSTVAQFSATFSSGGQPQRLWESLFTCWGFLALF